ncbi:hypothetical protein [Rhizobium laguerreae]|uniref:hypothetical protein n=1 Tax=Rhizobium laguerreae TaxID=1076926 RepID=UPI001C9280A3|nr:hypothetical protein [Rhizobium laguerreae]MBY3388502.1 hypothetical protein [Rhizobium laguerreae]MBY3402252.1 hypothetical protein [Rhizobium laguerreae]MBY3409191.1 hypothetical protein [Rhizobium laguerreae]
MRRRFLSCRASIAFVLSTCVFFSSRANAETLLCVEDVAGGLKFLDGEWQGVKFKVGGSQFAITATASDPLNYQVKQIGKDIVQFTCNRFKFESGALSDQMYCGGLGYGMVINFARLRYVEVYSLGYIEDDRSGQNTPSVTGGKCSTINP